MSTAFKVEGFKELEAEFAKLANPATRKASARRAMVKAITPTAETAREKAPRRRGNLADSIIVGTKTSGPNAGRQAFGQAMRSGTSKAEAVQAMRDVQRETASQAFVYMGPGRHPQAITQEFGTYFHPAQPYMRPAWDGDKNNLIPRISKELWADISKSIERAERKAARDAAKLKG